MQRWFVQRVSSRSRCIEAVGRRQANEDSTSLKDGMKWGGFRVSWSRGGMSSLTMTSSASVTLPCCLSISILVPSDQIEARSLASASGRCHHDGPFGVEVSPDLGHGSADPHPASAPTPTAASSSLSPHSPPRPPAEPCDQPSPMSQEHEIAQPGARRNPRLRLRTFDTAIGTRHTPRNVYIW